MTDEERLYDENQTKNNTDIEKCPSCGGNMEFNAEKGALVCPFCGTEVKLDFDHDAQEQNFESLFAKQESWGDETHVYVCQNCGAKSILDRKTIATKCPYCGTSNVVEKQEISGMKPNAVVPYKISQDDAVECAKKWAKKKIFAPHAFKKSLSAEDVSGSYMPAFTFDAKSVSFYRGRLGKNYTETEHRDGKTIHHTRTRYFTIDGKYKRDFDDILIHASERLPQKYLSKLGSFDTNEAEKYSSNFIHGYSAQNADREGKDCWNDANNYINNKIEKGILAKYDYDVVDYLKVNTTLTDKSYKYVLLPIYFGHFNYRKKLYNFFVSGHNGSASGKTPISPIRVMIAVLLGIVALGLFIFLLMLMNAGGNYMKQQAIHLLEIIL